MKRVYLVASVSLLQITLSACAVKSGIGNYNRALGYPGNVTSGTPIRHGVPLVGEVKLKEFAAAKAGASELDAEFSGTVFRSDHKLIDIDATWRVFLNSSKNRIRPYIGGGAGYYRFFTSTSYNACPTGYICTPYDPTGYVTDKLANGFNPHVLLGTDLPFKKDWSFLLEARYEFAKGSSRYPLTNTQFLLGFRFKGSVK